MMRYIITLIFLAFCSIAVSSCSDGPGNLHLPPRRQAPKPTQAVQALETRTNKLGMRFVLLPPGYFALGLAREQGGMADESPVTRSIFHAGTYMGETEVTQAQWQTVMGSNPSAISADKTHEIRNAYNVQVLQRIGPENPVDSVSWLDVQEFIARLNTLDPSSQYRLPTEAEWEYAAKAGSEDPLFAFNENRFPIVTGAQSLYSTMRGGVTFPVKSFPPNAWGLYDMDGNLREWCADTYGPYQATRRQGQLKVNRGPCWIDPQNVRITQRYCNNETVRAPFLGFRLVMTLGKH